MAVHPTSVQTGFATAECRRLSPPHRVHCHQRCVFATSAPHPDAPSPPTLSSVTGGSGGGGLAGGRSGHGSDAAPLSRALLTARVPVEGLLGWASRLRSLSGGEGGFVANFGGYEVCSAEERVVREERGY